MPRLVADTLELQDVDAGYYFEIRAGGLDDVPEVRGSDVVIPGKSGRATYSRVSDSMVVSLHGIVMGAGSGVAAAESYRTRANALKAVFDPTADPFALTVHSPLEGLPSGDTATLNVRFLRFVVGEQGQHFRIMDIECECVDSPPVWVVSEGS